MSEIKADNAADGNADRELLDLLYRNAPITLFASTAVAVLLLSSLYDTSAGPEAIVSWIIALVLFNLARLLLRSFRESSLVKDRYSRIWLRLYILTTLGAGILWSALVVIYRESDTLYEQVIMLAALLGMPMASLPNNALKLPVFYAFCMPTFIALQYWSYFVSTTSHIEFSVLALIYAGMVAVTGHIYHNSFKHVLRIKYEKEELVDRLSAANQRLEEFAYIDPLTGLTNRRWFSEQAEKALDRCRRRNKRLAILLIDLDNFKEVNDTLGHASGDEILVIVARRLKSALRQSDTLTISTEDTARFGGDEFILLLEDIETLENVTRATDRILQEVNEPIVLNDHSFNPGCSIGVSIYPDDAQSVSNLIRQADVALYHAKQTGKGCTCFFHPLSIDEQRP